MPYLINTQEPCPKCGAAMRGYVLDDGTLLSEWCRAGCNLSRLEAGNNGKRQGEGRRDSSSEGA